MRPPAWATDAKAVKRQVATRLWPRLAEQILSLSDSPETLFPTIGRWAVGEVSGKPDKTKGGTDKFFVLVHLIGVRTALASRLRVHPSPVFHIISAHPLPALAVISHRQCEPSSSVCTLADISHCSVYALLELAGIAKRQRAHFVGTCRHFKTSVCNPTSVCTLAGLSHCQRARSLASHCPVLHVTM